MLQARTQLAGLAGSSPSGGAEATTPRQLSILMVDDDETLRATLPVLLECLGHRAEVCPSGLEGLRWLEAHPWVDLVLLDQTMPGLTGVQTLERIRRHHPQLPVLFTTGAPESIPPSIIRTDPWVRVLTKPFTLEGLARAMEAFLGVANPRPATMAAGTSFR